MTPDDTTTPPAVTPTPDPPVSTPTATCWAATAFDLDATGAVFTLPGSALQTMPAEWQQRMLGCLEELCRASWLDPAAGVIGHLRRPDPVTRHRAAAAARLTEQVRGELALHRIPALVTGATTGAAEIRPAAGTGPSWWRRVHDVLDAVPTWVVRSVGVPDWFEVLERPEVTCDLCADGWPSMPPPGGWPHASLDPAEEPALEALLRAYGWLVSGSSRICPRCRPCLPAPDPAATRGEGGGDGVESGR